EGSFCAVGFACASPDGLAGDSSFSTSLLIIRNYPQNYRNTSAGGKQAWGACSRGTPSPCRSAMASEPGGSQSSHTSLIPPLLPQAAQKRYLSSHKLSNILLHRVYSL